jgi:nucleotide-binding universal stress UspA family protein
MGARFLDAEMLKGGRAMDTKIRPGVVAGIHASADGMALADLAADEARRRGVGLRLICLPDMEGARDPGLSRDAIRRRFSDRGVIIETCRGESAGALIEASRGACLLTVQAGCCCGRDPVLDVWLPDQVITHAHCPVLVAGPGRDATRATVSRPVLLGLDGSAHSTAAVPHAFEAADRRQAPLRVMSVHYPPPPSAETEQLLDKALSAWSDKYPQVAVAMERVYSPNVAAALVDASADAELIVAGARGRSTVTCLVLGSVSRALIEQARCPVLITHAYERAP